MGHIYKEKQKQSKLRYFQNFLFRKFSETGFDLGLSISMFFSNSITLSAANHFDGMFLKTVLNSGV